MSSYASMPNVPTPDEVSAFVFKNGDPWSSRLVIYSSDIPDKHNFAEAVKVSKREYQFAGSSASTIVRLIRGAVACRQRVLGSCALFESIGVACHGPGTHDSDCFEWKLSEKVVLTDPRELVDPQSPMAEVMHALGEAVVPGGRVDL